MQIQLFLASTITKIPQNNKILEVLSILNAEGLKKKNKQANATYDNIPNPSYGSFLVAHQSNNVKEKNNVAFIVHLRLLSFAVTPASTSWL